MGDTEAWATQNSIHDVTTSDNWWENLTDHKVITDPVPEFHNLGKMANSIITSTTFILALVAILLNFGVVSYYRRHFKEVVPFIYTILGLSDLCTGICSLLHSVVFFMIIFVEGEESIHLFWVATFGYFTTIVCFRLSAFISMLFSSIRTINITNPFRIVNRKAVFLSVFTYVAVWVVVLMVELSFMIDKDIKSSAFFLRTAFYHSASFSYTVDRILAGKVLTKSIQCIAAMTMTALPTFLPAVLALIGSIIQIYYLIVPESAADNSDSRKQKINIGITIVIITVVFFFCASFTMTQSIAICVSETGLIPNITSYMLGYMPMFLNAALNPLILIIRSRKLNSYMKRKLRLKAVSVSSTISHKIDASNVESGTPTKKCRSSNVRSTRVSAVSSVMAETTT